MSMIFIQTYFEKLIRVAGTQFQTYGFEGGFVPLGENLSAVFDWTDQVED